MPGSVRFSSGFTLLEAIVALAVFAAVSSALAAWVGVTIQAVSQIEAARQRDEAVQAGLAMLVHVNPLEQPEGLVEAGHFEISWTSDLIAGPQNGMSPDGGLSLYQVALAEVQVVVFDGRTHHAFSTRKAGWRQVLEDVPI